MLLNQRYIPIAYIWDPLRLVNVGYDYRLYYFIKFISLCKNVSSYSYTLILMQYINKRLGDYIPILKMRDFLTCI